MRGQSQTWANSITHTCMHTHTSDPDTLHSSWWDQCRPMWRTMCNNFLLSFTNLAHARLYSRHVLVCVDDIGWLCWLTPCRVRCHSSAFYSKDITKTDYLAEDWAFLITQSGLLVQIYPIIFAVISSEVTVCCDSPVNGLGLWWIVVITMTVSGCTAGDNSLSALPVREDLNKLIGRSWRLLCILSPEHYTNRNTNKIMCTLEVCLFNTWSSYYVLKFLLPQRWKASLQKIKYKHLENIQKIV